MTGMMRDVIEVPFGHLKDLSKPVFIPDENNVTVAYTCVGTTTDSVMLKRRPTLEQGMRDLRTFREEYHG